MEKVKKYIEMEGCSIKKFAEKAGISTLYFYQILSGRRAMSKKVAEKIELATDGMLKKEDLYFSK